MKTAEACEHLSEALARHVDGRAAFAETREAHRRMRALIERCGNAARISNLYAIRARLLELEETADVIMAHHASAGALFAQAQSATRSAAAALTTEASQ